MPVLGTSTSTSSTGITNSVTPEQYGAVGNTSSHDDAPAIEAAIAAAVAACIADGSYVCEVVFDAAKNYYANRAPVGNPTINGAQAFSNAQIALPYLAWQWHYPNSTPLVTLTLRSKQSGQASNTTFAQQPCSIISTYTGAGGVTGYGLASIIGGPSWQQQSVEPQQWSGINLVWDGINIAAPANPTLTGLDLTTINTCDIKSLHVYVPTNGYQAPTACTNRTAFGVRFPANQNGGNIRVGTLEVNGFYTGISMPEHIRAENLMLYWNQLALSYDVQGDHEAIINYLQTTGNVNLIASLNPNTGIGDLPAANFPPTHINLWGSEDITGKIWDANNVLNLNATIYNVGITQQRIPTVSGGAKVKITSLNQARGAITAPTVPATTVAYTNGYGRDAWVIVTGGTVSGIAIDGVATGLTAGQVLVPNGKTITLTYTAAPTWQWVLF